MNQRLILFVLLLLTMATHVYADNVHQFSHNSLLGKIEADYVNAEISQDQKALYQIQAIKSPEKLPDKYKSLSATLAPEELREATLAIIDVKLNWDSYNPATQQALTSALERVAAAFTYISPSGFFKLHFDTLGVDAVPAADTNANLVPDFVEKCASYLDTSLTKHLELGYLTPPSDGGMGGDTLFDVYFEDMSYYGYAVPEAPGSYAWDDYFSYLVLNNNFLGFPTNNDPEGLVAGAAKATAAHEFHHCIQFAYDVAEGSWFMELDATYMEDIVFDLVDDNYNYLPGFMSSPQSSLMDNSPSHKYASFIWASYLAEKFDTSLNVAAWEGARYNTIYNTYSDTIMSRYGWTQDSAYADFTSWNYITGSRDDGLHYEEASFYPEISIGATYSSYPVSLQNSPSNVSGYGESYITFNPGLAFGKLRITFNGSDSRQWKAYVIKSSGSNTHEIEYINLHPVTFNGEIIIENFENYNSVTLVGVNVSEFSSGVLYTYSANIILPYEVSSKILTEDSSVYSGGSKLFDVQVNNTAIISDIFRVIYWDDQGWLPIDTVNFALDSGDSNVVSINVSPPQGTSLSDISRLQIKTESWGDTSVNAIDTMYAVIALQRGDVNFSGSIDIADIVDFVSYSFGGGNSPQPIILSADFDCNGLVNISDLVELVDYSFNSGPYCACNPY